MDISLIGFLILLALALVIGLIAKGIMGFHRGGLLTAIGLGFVGGLLGVIIPRVTNLPELLVVEIGGTRFPVVWALVGTILLIMLVSMVTGRGRFATRRYG